MIVHVALGASVPPDKATTLPFGAAMTVPPLQLPTTFGVDATKTWAGNPSVTATLVKVFPAFGFVITQVIVEILFAKMVEGPNDFVIVGGRGAA